LETFALVALRKYPGKPGAAKVIPPTTFGSTLATYSASAPP